MGVVHQQVRLAHAVFPHGDQLRLHVADHHAAAAAAP